MPRLLVVHHTPSPALHTMFEAVVAGAAAPELQEVEIVPRPALTCSAVDVLDTDGCVLGTPVNLGYVSGALKHFFDTVYYPCLDATRGRAFGVYLHGNDDAAGAQRALDKITTGLGWRRVAPDVVVAGAPSRGDVDACRDLGATVAATLLG